MARGGKSSAGRGNRLCQGPEVENCLVNLRASGEAAVVGAEGGREGERRGGQRSNRVRSGRGPWAATRSELFLLQKKRLRVREK